MSMPPQPPQPPKPHHVTWIDSAGDAWRAERTDDLRWQLSRYRPAVEAWVRIGSFPSRGEALAAAADPGELS
jgi:hypothetical protein